MELRHLRYFVAVAEEENVTRAAARLHVSQPPLTRQIHDLEHELGFDLFTRAGKSLRLTDAGRAFLEEARAVLARLETGIAVAREVAGGRRGELHVGYAPSPTIAVLPRALQRFQDSHPGVRVTLHDESTPQMLSGVRERRLHLALLMEPPKPALTGIAFEPLRDFPIMIATSPGHRLARKRQVTIAEVLREPIVALSRREYDDYHALLGRIFGSEADRLRIVEECDSGMSFIAAIEAGRGIAITISAIRDSAGRRVRLLPLTPSPPPATMGVAYARDGMTALASAFLQEAKNAAAIGSAPGRRR